LIAIYYLLLLLGFTLLFLFLIKFDLDKFLKAIFFVSIGFVIFFVATVIGRLFIFNAEILLIIGAIFGGLSVLALWKKPEWYVIDSIGLVMAVGIVALLGISLGILPVLILLIALAAYDAISVYKTKHMIKLADGVMDMGLPLLLIVPKKLPYSFMKNKPRIQSAEKKEREAFFIGLGDIIIPGILPASAFWFTGDELMVFGLPANLVIAMCTIAGGVIGLLLLMRIVLKGNPQAGLPLLNAGTIAGFFISYLMIFGLDFSWII
ncbi:MAG: presenilin family intramembrane aspartyl protease, partial [Thermoplasmata archaeon]|nr:presenilin family intramembrane aspartyl protease [Thermoplasmata archaeon]